jgi:hypothetical protein
VDHSNHLLSVYLQRGANCDRSCRRHAIAGNRRDSLLTDELARRQECNRGLFPRIRNDRELRTAFLKIEDRVGDISLRKEGLFRLQMNDPLP